MRITTDHKWKPFKYRDEVPAKVLADQFDYQNEEDALDGFFRYRGYWYHIDEFMAMHRPGYDPDPFPPPWSGYTNDSFFSGVLIELSLDGEMYRVGTYTC